jgi:hypothetical protein
MNKYMGFYEMKGINFPTVPWRLFTPEAVLDDGLLWSVRVAVENSSDLNLPRAIGVNAEEAMRQGCGFLDNYQGKGIVIYYPYFIAQKSGVLDIDCRRTVIEAVEKDLWNLVTYGRKNVSIILPFETSGGGDGHFGDRDFLGRDGQYFGDRGFLGRDEISELLGYGSVLRGRFRGELSEGGSILAEWSYAYHTDIKHEPIGDRYLVFYELRGL